MRRDDDRNLIVFPYSEPPKRCRVCTLLVIALVCVAGWIIVAAAVLTLASFLR